MSFQPIVVEGAGLFYEETGPFHAYFVLGLAKDKTRDVVTKLVLAKDGEDPKSKVADEIDVFAVHMIGKLLINGLAQMEVGVVYLDQLPM